MICHAGHGARTHETGRQSMIRGGASWEAARGETSRVTTVLIGDSQTWRVGPRVLSVDGRFAPRGAHYPSIGWFNWANAALGAALSIVANLALPGKRADEVLAEQVPTVVAMPVPPALCCAYVGINDVAQGRTASGIIRDLDAIFAAVGSVGVVVAAATIMTTASLTDSQKKEMHTVNAWLRRQSQSRDAFILIDWAPHLADADGDPVSGFYVDGVHPTPAGAARMGAVAAGAFESFVPWMGDVSFPAELPKPHIGSSELYAGTAGPGVTGIVASGWEISAEHGSADVEASVLHRNDGVAGEWQELRMADGAVRAEGRLVPATAGQIWEAAVEIETDGDASEHLVHLGLRVDVSGSGQSLSCLGSDPEVPSMEGEPLCDAPPRMVLRTPPLLLAAGARGLVLRVHAFGGTGAGSVRIGRVALSEISRYRQTPMQALIS
jgi:lysophospholipase L1-like esterase